MIYKEHTLRSEIQNFAQTHNVWSRTLLDDIIHAYMWLPTNQKTTLNAWKCVKDDNFQALQSSEKEEKDEDHKQFPKERSIIRLTDEHACIQILQEYVKSAHTLKKEATLTDAEVNFLKFAFDVLQFCKMTLGGPVLDWMQIKFTGNPS